MDSHTPLPPRAVSICPAMDQRTRKTSLKTSPDSKLSRHIMMTRSRQRRERDFQLMSGDSSHGQGEEEVVSREGEETSAMRDEKTSKDLKNCCESTRLTCLTLGVQHSNRPPRCQSAGPTADRQEQGSSVTCKNEQETSRLCIDYQRIDTCVTNKYLDGYGEETVGLDNEQMEPVDGRVCCKKETAHPDRGCNRRRNLAGHVVGLRKKCNPSKVCFCIQEDEGGGGGHSPSASEGKRTPSSPKVDKKNTYSKIRRRGGKASRTDVGDLPVTQHDQLGPITRSRSRIQAANII